MTENDNPYRAPTYRAPTGEQSNVDSDDLPEEGYDWGQYFTKVILLIFVAGMIATIVQGC